MRISWDRNKFLQVFFFEKKAFSTDCKISFSICSKTNHLHPKNPINFKHKCLKLWDEKMLMHSAQLHTEQICRNRYSRIIWLTKLSTWVFIMWTWSISRLRLELNSNYTFHWFSERWLKEIDGFKVACLASKRIHAQLFLPFTW